MNHVFSPAELRVVKLIARGMSTKEIAEQLELSPKTIEFHSQNARRKIGHPSPIVLTHYAINHNIIKPLSI